jgi:hypothetical protein
MKEAHFLIFRILPRKTVEPCLENLPRSKKSVTEGNIKSLAMA